MTTRAPLFHALRATESIPPSTPHAVSVSLPTWQDNIDYEEGAARIHDAMKSGYPRFFIHTSIQRLAARYLKQYGGPGEKVILMASALVARRCRAFVLAQRTVTGVTEARGEVRVMALSPDTNASGIGVHAVFFPEADWPLAKAFWQHTGDGISSRLAEDRLRLIRANDNDTPPVTVCSSDCDDEEACADGESYVEMRFGRNLGLQLADEAKIRLRQRIAGVIAEENCTCQDAVDRGVPGLTEEHVYLFPCGMSAIFNTHRILLAMHPERKSVCFGFPYIDTLKILSKFGPGCHFLGYATNDELDALERQLSNPETFERVLAVFCEFPGNPLLRSPDVQRLRELADRYDFAVIVDETVGCFSNIQVLPWADAVVSSLTKVFSGDSNVMGGSLVVNTNRPFGARLKQALDGKDSDGCPGYEDLLWSEDAIFLERNSRTFSTRVARINKNTEALCDYLRAHPKVANVYYPKYVTPEVYDKFRRPHAGYGGLFSILLQSPESAPSFFDALACAKGPSLGTNFTLACPYTLLAHYTELEWAAKYGVDAHLVRVSVGLEDLETLRNWFDAALAAVPDTPSTADALR
ncbi:PLP-dependent transferase [Thamnocephalis sphaerospora]|uniref:PLP-dependent transferase n=1 Tax=Thamnocephalis sphaerospora TaxID=78915 RepID=A0A4P9XK86_9FUNG|nr:PLP-dependent transferase [Thamnocephalis sphaerospora]|eukprot:RKP06175.1 PLP-dependent transferase [Thamnocephalis sphaerospora]